MALNIALGVIALVGAALGVPARHRVRVDAAPHGRPPATPRTVAVTQGPVTATVSAAGSVQSANTAAADFTTAGTVTSISVKVGDTVTKGQVLAQVDPTAAQAQLTTAEANLTAAKASLTRANTGGDDGDHRAAQAQVTTAQAAVDDAEPRRRRHAP